MNSFELEVTPSELNGMDFDGWSSSQDIADPLSALSSSGDLSISDFTMDFSELNDLSGLRFDLEETAGAGWLESRNMSSTRSGRGRRERELALELPLERPKRLLKEPEPVEKEGDFLIQPKSGKVWRILRWEEAEAGASRRRKSGAQARDYYRVTAIEQSPGASLSSSGASGAPSSRGARKASAKRRFRERELWVFSSPHQPGFFLFGYFE
jgi:hypothetical protein